MAAQEQYIVGVDTRGTFTDVVVMSESRVNEDSQALCSTNTDLDEWV